MKIKIKTNFIQMKKVNKVIQKKVLQKELNIYYFQNQKKNKEKKDLVNEIWNLRNDKLVKLKKFVGKKKTKELINLFNDQKPLFKKFIIDENIELKLISILEKILQKLKK